MNLKLSAYHRLMDTDINYNVHNQIDASVTIYWWFQSPQHVSGDNFAHSQEQAASSVHYNTSCKHSLVLLRKGEIIDRNMLSWLKLLINCYWCIHLVVYIIVSVMHGHTNIKFTDINYLTFIYKKMILLIMKTFSRNIILNENSAIL
jgi:hypothetical protein